MAVYVVAKAHSNPQLLIELLYLTLLFESNDIFILNGIHMKLMNILRRDKLTESTRSTRFIWGELGYAADNVSGYDKNHSKRMRNIDAGMAKHYPGVSANDIYVYTTNSPAEYAKINSAAKKVGILGFWVDKTTFIFNAGAE